MFDAEPGASGRRRLTTVAFCAAALTAAGAGVLANATAATPTLAPALGSADQGGAVIVWLKDDHTNLNLRSAAGARIAAAHTDQKPVVAAIRDNGGTDIVQLVSVNAVAAHVSAAGVAALRALPAVKEIIPDATVPVGDPEPTGPQVKAAKITPDKAALAKSKSAQRRRRQSVPDGQRLRHAGQPADRARGAAGDQRARDDERRPGDRARPRRGRRQRRDQHRAARRSRGQPELRPPGGRRRRQRRRRRDARRHHRQHRRRVLRRRLVDRRAGHGPLPVLQGAAVLRPAGQLLLQARR